MFSCITETFFVWLYVFGYNHHFVFQLLAVSTIFCRKFFQAYPPNIRQISAKFPSISTIFCHKFAHYFATNLLITITNFPYFLFITMTKFTQICALDWPYLRYFIHYVDKFSPKSRKYIHLWNSIPNISKFLWFWEWFIRMPCNLYTW